MLRSFIITMSPTQSDRCARLMRACEVYGAKCVDVVRHIRWVGSPFTAILACKLRPRTQKPHTQAIAADSKSICQTSCNALTDSVHDVIQACIEDRPSGSAAQQDMTCMCTL